MKFQLSYNFSDLFKFFSIKHTFTEIDFRLCKSIFFKIQNIDGHKEYKFEMKELYLPEFKYSAITE